MIGSGDFTLDPRLEQDTLCLGKFPLSLLLLMNDSTYPWLILVPQRPEIREVYQLDRPTGSSCWLNRATLPRFSPPFCAPTS